MVEFEKMLWRKKHEDDEPRFLGIERLILELRRSHEPTDQRDLAP